MGEDESVVMPGTRVKVESRSKKGGFVEIVLQEVDAEVDDSATVSSSTESADESPCPACGGNGNDDTRYGINGKCVNCDGTGKVESPEGSPEAEGSSDNTSEGS